MIFNEIVVFESKLQYNIHNRETLTERAGGLDPLQCWFVFCHKNVSWSVLLRYREIVKMMNVCTGA